MFMMKKAEATRFECLQVLMVKIHYAVLQTHNVNLNRLQNACSITAAFICF